ncbi:hypothetical protein BpHYR1_045224 [Brachionus plicatilis]|uniref:Uncharacterized protein n=1 Tax=Brachionus plicatilis TaxID=10195 RepID=A0A3M7R527_BRAPC|nr:hypothetical protein BpHYR1_045224 [Brachionus plicatilis]
MIESILLGSVVSQILVSQKPGGKVRHKYLTDTNKIELLINKEIVKKFKELHHKIYSIIKREICLFIPRLIFHNSLIKNFTGHNI